MKYHRFWLGTVAFGMLLCSCGAPETVEITQTREIDASNGFEIPALAESDHSRFRFKKPTATDGAASQPSAAKAPQLVWTTPEGWKEVAQSSFREVNLRFGDSDEGECYITRLGRSDLTENVNRWRKQVGAEPLSATQVAELPKRLMFGQQATLVSVDGDFAGMGKAAKTNYRLRGLILNVGNSMVTVKMTGPMELVGQNEAKFDAFCASLDLRS